MTFDATFWVAVSFIIFIGALVYFKIPQNINKLLSKMIIDIKLFNQYCNTLKHGCGKNRIEYIPIYTDQSLDSALTELLLKRKNY